MTGFVYVLMNESMPGLVKIGSTTKPVKRRAEELWRETGVPTPFEIAHEAEAQNAEYAEKIVHELLAEFRVRPDREFFRVTVDKAIESIEKAIEQIGRIPKSPLPTVVLMAEIDPGIAKRVKKYVEEGKFGVADYEPKAIEAIRDMIISNCERGRETFYREIMDAGLPFRSKEIQQQLHTRGDACARLLGSLLGRLACDSYLETGIFLSAVTLGTGDGADGFGNLMKELGIACSEPDVIMLQKKHYELAFERYKKGHDMGSGYKT